MVAPKVAHVRSVHRRVKDGETNSTPSRLTIESDCHGATLNRCTSGATLETNTPLLNASNLDALAGALARTGPSSRFLAKAKGFVWTPGH